MSKSDTTPDAPLDLTTDRTRLARAEAEHAELEAAVARGGPLPTWAEIIVARAMREGFAGPYDDPDDGPMAA